MDSVIKIAKFLWFLMLFKSTSLSCGSVFIRTAHIKRIISTAAAKTCENVRRKNLKKVSKMWNIVYIR